MEVVGVAEDPIVSSDIIKDSRGLNYRSQLRLWMVTNYDNEWGQSNGERGRANRQGW